MINEIHNFCKVRDDNRKSYSNRAKFLVDLLTRLGIEHKIVRTKSEHFQKYFYNIYCFGTSDKFLSAHHDVVNLQSDNANDNSASVINCIAYKIKNPAINLLILDGEEPPYMGAGSKYASLYLKKNNISVKWILNLELTGLGNNFFIDNIPTRFSACIQDNFPNAIVTSTPFNDAMIFREYGFESNVLTMLNVDEKGKGDYTHMYHMHTVKDSLSTISTQDMQAFVDGPLDQIVKSATNTEKYDLPPPPPQPRFFGTQNDLATNLNEMDIKEALILVNQNVTDPTDVIEVARCVADNWEELVGEPLYFMEYLSDLPDIIFDILYKLKLMSEINDFAHEFVVYTENKIN